jgi:cellulose synthase/poly-beta-1,6-N-acetylglucosamine synthase-like glycosyltransferase
VQTQTILQRTTYTVGICALTEVENTLRLIGQILTTYEEGLLLKELIVATPNQTLANRLQDHDGRVTVILEETREGKTPALRKILQKATGDILILSSADIRLGKHTIARLARSLADNVNLGAVDSKVELVNGDVRLSDRVSTLVWEIHNAMLEKLDTDGQLGHVAGDLMGFRRSLIDEIPDVINDDAYLAFEVRRKGFTVKRDENALVWIAAPGNPADYVSQRSRVLLGHLQLVRAFGAVPTTFEFTLFSRPVRNLRVLNTVIARFGPSYLPTLFTATFLEILSFATALVGLVCRRKYGPWRIIWSTKRG